MNLYILVFAIILSASQIQCTTSGGFNRTHCFNISPTQAFSCIPLPDFSSTSWCCPYSLYSNWMCNYASEAEDPNQNDSPDNCKYPMSCGCYSPNSPLLSAWGIAGIVMGSFVSFLILLCCINLIRDEMNRRCAPRDPRPISHEEIFASRARESEMKVLHILEMRFPAAEMEEKEKKFPQTPQHIDVRPKEAAPLPLFHIAEEDNNDPPSIYGAPPGVPPSSSITLHRQI